MATRLEDLRVDRSQRQDEPGPRRPLFRSAVIGAIVLIAAGDAFFAVLKVRNDTTPTVQVMRVRPALTGTGSSPVQLHANGYIVPEHEIEVASKIAGRRSAQRRGATGYQRKPDSRRAPAPAGPDPVERRFRPHLSRMGPRDRSGGRC